MSLIPFYLDPEIIDITRLRLSFGSVHKKFKDYEEMDKWMKKSNKLSPGWKTQR